MKNTGKIELIKIIIMKEKTKHIERIDNKVYSEIIENIEINKSAAISWALF